LPDIYGRPEEFVVIVSEEGKMKIDDFSTNLASSIDNEDI